MNLIYDAKTPPRIFIDTTVFCGALRADGVNRKILQSARYPYLFRPVVSKVCLLEFIRNAHKGLGGVTYTKYEIQLFIDLFLDPILQEYAELPVNSTVGRYSVETILREHKSIGSVLIELSKCEEKTAQEILSTKEMQESLYKYDQDDAHVWVTALETNTDYILTSNRKRFPKEIGSISTIHPVEFYKHLNFEV